MNKITTALQKEPNGTIKLTITIPSSDVKKTWEEVMGEIVKNEEIQGFRKGKAPRKLDDPNLETSKGWQFTALTCEAPVIKLGKYKESIQEITAKSKIIIPGKSF